MTDKMIARKEGQVGHLIFNNPERHNAVSFEMWRATLEILDDFAADGGVRVVVLSGAGGKAFVSGADISKFEDERATEEAVARYNAMTDRVYTRVHGFPKPTIAMIRGFCIGGGLNLAMCCDIRVCSENARFALPAAKLGLGYGYAGLKRFVDAIGPAFTKEIFFSARQYDAAEARSMGLVNRVVANEQLEAETNTLAETIAANAPLTVNSVKFIVGEVLKPEAERDLAQCAKLVQACFASRDYVEGRTAFMEKRKPQFAGA
jgi:enoyl-CoA hydratase/carnithine racemase